MESLSLIPSAAAINKQQLQTVEELRCVDMKKDKISHQKRCDILWQALCHCRGITFQDVIPLEKKILDDILDESTKVRQELLNEEFETVHYNIPFRVRQSRGASLDHWISPEDREKTQRDDQRWSNPKMEFSYQGDSPFPNTYKFTAHLTVIWWKPKNQMDDKKQVEI